MSTEATLVNRLKRFGYGQHHGPMAKACADAALEIERLRYAMHTIFCSTEVDAIPHRSYDELAKSICECAAAALNYENLTPTKDQVASIMGQP